MVSQLCYWEAQLEALWSRPRTMVKAQSVRFVDCFPSKCWSDLWLLPFNPPKPQFESSKGPSFVFLWTPSCCVIPRCWPKPSGIQHAQPAASSLSLSRCLFSEGSLVWLLTGCLLHPAFPPWPAFRERREELSGAAQSALAHNQLLGKQHNICQKRLLFLNYDFPLQAAATVRVGLYLIMALFALIKRHPSVQTVAHKTITTMNIKCLFKHLQFIFIVYGINLPREAAG